MALYRYPPHIISYHILSKVRVFFALKRKNNNNNKKCTSLILTKEVGDRESKNKQTRSSILINLTMTRFKSDYVI